MDASHIGRPGTGERARRWTLATAALLLLYSGLGLLLVGDYGITYDEYVHSRNGENVLAWYTSGFKDQSFRTYANLRFYGVLLDLPAVAVHRATGADLYLVRHLFTLAFAVLTVAGIARLAARLNGPAAGFFAALVLILTPRFFGHGFNNGKDVPLAACTVWAVTAAVAFAQRLPRPGVNAVVALGIWWGLALAMRMSALSMAAIIGIAILGWWLTNQPRQTIMEVVRVVALPLCAVAVVAALVMLPSWPFIQVSPVFGTARILRDQWGGGMGSIPVLYDGQVISHRQVPAAYVWVWLTRTTPEFYAVGIALACAAAAAHRPWRRHAMIGWTTVGAAATLPLLLATATRPAVYDGLRHFLFATVFLAVPAGAGVAWCVRGGGARVLRGLACMVLCAGAVLTIADMVRLHPYQTAWFNRSVAGGLAGAAGRWDTDYWGNAFREGTLWLADHVPSASPRPRVASSASPPQTEHYLPSERFEYIGSVSETPALARNRYTNPPDYYIAFVRWGADRVYPGDVVHRVERDGVPLLVVVKVDRAAALTRQSAVQGKAR